MQRTNLPLPVRRGEGWGEGGIQLNRKLISTAIPKDFGGAELGDSIVQRSKIHFEKSCS
jgi:hypothetical protein